jgi:hypothetical protein
MVRPVRAAPDSCPAVGRLLAVRGDVAGTPGGGVPASPVARTHLSAVGRGLRRKHPGREPLHVAVRADDDDELLSAMLTTIAAAPPDRHYLPVIGMKPVVDRPFLSRRKVL